MLIISITKGKTDPAPIISNCFGAKFFIFYFFFQSVLNWVHFSSAMLNGIYLTLLPVAVFLSMY